MANSTDQEYYALHVYKATLSKQDNYKSSSWLPTGEHIKLNNPISGYLADAVLLDKHPTAASLDVGGVSAPGHEYLQLQEEDKGLADALGGSIDNWVILVIRTWKLQQMQHRIFVNNRGTSIWAKLLTCNSMSISIEVHSVADQLNDGGKVSMNSVDCMNNERVPSHGIAGHRLPHMIEPPLTQGPPSAERWSPNLITF